MITDVYVDLDGVLVDFVSKIEELTQMKISDINAIPGNEIIRNLLNEEVEKGFYLNLPPVKDVAKMIELVKYCKEHYYTRALTVCYGNNFDLIADHKQQWLNNNGFEGLKLIGVARSREKSLYANPRTILIDDRSRSCEPFRHSDGIAVKHRSADHTIITLRGIGVIDKRHKFSWE